MTVFLVNVGNKPHNNSGALVIRDYLRKYNINYFILEHNNEKVHPSWLKLIANKFIDDDFILCWDLDLLPKNTAPDLTSYIDFSKINLVRDISIDLSIPEFLKIKNFKYNCGLIGIPKKHFILFNDIFNKHKNSELPSYEQFHVNNAIIEENLDINELDIKFNTLYYTNKDNIKNLIKAHFLHYTALNMPLEIKISLINKHVNRYFK